MNSRIIQAAKTAERNYFCFVDADRKEHRFSPFDLTHVLRTYDTRHPGHWAIDELDRCIVSLCRYRYLDRDRGTRRRDRGVQGARRICRDFVRAHGAQRRSDGRLIVLAPRRGVGP